MPWDDLARRQHGVVTRSQLLEVGVTERAVDGFLARGELGRVHAGVYLARGAPSTYMSTLWAAALATRGLFGDATACHLWGVLEKRPAPITILIPHGRRVIAPSGVRLRRRSGSIAQTTRRGLLVTPRSDSVLDLLGTLSPQQAGSFFDRALQQRWISADDVARRLARAQRGNSQLRALARVLGDGAEAESERQLHRLLRGAGLSDWRPNLPVVVRGRRYRIDVAFPDLRIAIEVDGMAWHLDADRKQRDLHRQNDLVAAGWMVLAATTRHSGGSSTR